MLPSDVNAHKYRCTCTQTCRWMLHVVGRDMNLRFSPQTQTYSQHISVTEAVALLRLPPASTQVVRCVSLSPPPYVLHSHDYWNVKHSPCRPLTIFPADIVHVFRDGRCCGHFILDGCFDQSNLYWVGFLSAAPVLSRLSPSIWLPRWITNIEFWMSFQSLT